jgi:hypothetical protein
MKALVEVDKPILAVIQNRSGEIVHVLCTHLVTSWNKEEVMYLIIQDNLMEEDDVERMRGDGFTLVGRIESWLEANSYEFRMIESTEIVGR